MIEMYEELIKQGITKDEAVKIILKSWEEGDWLAEYSRLVRYISSK